MPQARPDYVIDLAAIGVLLAIGIPALERGERLLGGACLVVAAALAVWFVVKWLRSRG